MKSLRKASVGTPPLSYNASTEKCASSNALPCRTTALDPLPQPSSSLRPRPSCCDDSDVLAGRLVIWDPVNCNHGPGDLPITEALLCRAHDTDGCRFCHESCDGFQVLHTAVGRRKRAFSQAHCLFCFPLTTECTFIPFFLCLRCACRVNTHATARVRLCAF